MWFNFFLPNPYLHRSIAKSMGFWRFFSFFAITCIWSPELCTASYLPYLILVSGHCLFPLSIEGIYLAYQPVPWPSFVRPLVMKFWGNIQKKAHFAELLQVCFGLYDFFVHTALSPRFLSLK